MNLKDKKQGIFYITYAMVLFFLLYNIKTLLGLGNSIVGILLPFIAGAGVAFILSVPMGFIERNLTKLAGGKKAERWKRPVSLILTLVLFVAIIAIVVVLIIPAVRDAAEKIIETVPMFLTTVINWMEEAHIPADELEAWLNEMTINWAEIGQKALSFVKNWSTGFVVSTVDVVSSVIGMVADSVIAFIFAIYILCAKENLYRQFKMILYAFVPEKAADQLMKVGKLTHRTFSNFFAGQCLEACILGGMFVVTMTVLRIPYAILIGVLIAVTALIPIFGAFIGCAVGVFLILMVNPMKALVFFIMFFVLQQIEGNLIYPKVVGGSVGLPSIWVLMAVSVGGSLAGVIGMILFIPLFSVVYALFREQTYSRLNKNQRIKKKVE